MEHIFLRTEALIGTEALDRLKQASVAVIGLGGVGSYAVESLARSGIGHITIVDYDQVEASNINRQLPALISTIGEYKVDVIEERLMDINPDLTICKFKCSYNSDNSEEILQGPLDYVVDAIDSWADKIHLITTCLTGRVNIISSMGTANRINPELLKIADISQTSVCPVARKVRKELRKNGIETGLKVVYSTENPLPAAGITRLGSIAFVPAVAGLLLASEVVKSIVYQGDNKE